MIGPKPKGYRKSWRPCTCHQDDNPPVPCARRYALSECLAATRSAIGASPAEQSVLPREASQ